MKLLKSCHAQPIGMNAATILRAQFTAFIVIWGASSAQDQPRPFIRAPSGTTSTVQFGSDESN